MEDVIDPPRMWELELICHRRYLFDDLEGSISFWGQFGLLMAELEIRSF
jgi:hypothetical protein